MNNVSKVAEASKPAAKTGSNTPKAAQKTKAKTIIEGADKKASLAKTAAVERSVKTDKHLKSHKSHKPKMVRDSFTMPEADYAKIGLLKARCLENGIEIKKSELLRAGLTALSKMPVTSLVKALGGVERLKTGRPKTNQS